jgi:hypothetical protein
LTVLSLCSFLSRPGKPPRADRSLEPSGAVAEPVPLEAAKQPAANTAPSASLPRADSSLSEYFKSNGCKSQFTENVLLTLTLLTHSLRGHRPLPRRRCHLLVPRHCPRLCGRLPQPFPGAGHVLHREQGGVSSPVLGTSARLFLSFCWVPRTTTYLVLLATSCHFLHEMHEI